MASRLSSSSRRLASTSSRLPNYIVASRSPSLCLTRRSLSSSNVSARTSGKTAATALRKANRWPSRQDALSTLLGARMLSTAPPPSSPSPTSAPSRFTASEMTEEQYHQLSDEALDALLDTLEGLFYADGSNEGMNGFEVEYNSGVMTISFGEQHGTYVLNKQPPNKQIWLSSPISGPKRYDYDAEKETWFYSREHVSLGELLTQEFQNIIAEDVDLPIR